MSKTKPKPVKTEWDDQDADLATQYEMDKLQGIETREKPRKNAD